METYAELLLRKEREVMTNYSQDEDDRINDRLTRAKRNSVNSVKIGKDETPYTAVDIEISDDVFRKVAFQAHERDITFNKMVGLILKAELQSSEHRFEHHNSPQVLKEY
jgi:hypothetical protein